MRRLVATFALLLAAVPAGAADLRLQVLDADRNAALADAMLNPAPQDTALLISVGTPGLLLRHVYVRIDGGALIHHQYSDDEGLALLAQGLHPLATVPLADGDHVMRFEVIARHVDDKPGETRVRQHLELPFTKTPGRMRLGVDVREEGLVTKEARVQVAGWSGPASPVGTGDEIDARAASWFANANRPVEALAALSRAGGGTTDGAGVRTAVFAQWGLGPVEPSTAESLIGAFDDAAAALAPPGSDPAPMLAVLQLPACQNPTASICDRGRVLLGYHYLRHYDGESASAAFRAVHVPGPWTSRALLGLGWAFLAPRKGAAVAEPASYQMASAAQWRSRMPIPHGEERKEAMLAALVPWAELVGRDALDPAQQEGELAIAWALESLGAYQQAQKRRQTSVATLEAVRAHLADAMVQAQDGRLASLVLAGNAVTESGWDRTLAPVSDSDATNYLRWLMTDDAFGAAARDLRDVRDLSMLLDADAARLRGSDDPRATAALGAIAALQPEVQAAETMAKRRLGETARPVLESMRRETEGYLVEARFALARTYDRPEAEEIIQ